MSPRNPREDGNLGRSFGCGEIFVAFDVYRHTEFAVHRKYPRHSAAAAHSHIFSERDLSRHHESQLDRVALPNLKIGVEESPTATQILGETTPFPVSPR